MVSNLKIKILQGKFLQTAAVRNASDYDVIRLSCRGLMGGTISVKIGKSFRKLSAAALTTSEKLLFVH